jgi:hypothetical protein
MKMNKTCTAVALALGLGTAAQAQTIYITGSTAFHNQVGQALTDMGLTFGAGTKGATEFACSGAVSDTQGLGISTTGLGAITVEANFQGSAEGILSAASGVSPGYETTTGAADPGPGDGADLAFSDVFQTTTSYAGLTALKETSAADANTVVTGLTGVAIQPFGWFANSAARTLGVSNVTPAIISSLYGGNGTLGINFWTGANPGASTNLVYAVGRSNDSGTRVSALVDVGLSFLSTVSQYAVNGSLAKPAPHAGDTLGPVGNNGYTSGGSVAIAIGDDFITLPAIGYIGLADAQSSGGVYAGTNAGALTFEGVNIGSSNAWNISSVVNGEYSFWSYEHLYNASGTATFTTNNFAPVLVRYLEYEITNNLALTNQTAVVFSQMNVSRDGDGAAVVNGN